MSGADAGTWPALDGRSVAAQPQFDQGIFLTHLNRGRQLLDAERFQEAQVELEQALRLRPRHEMALNLVGMLYFKLDMRPQAAAVYRLLLEVHPEADVLHSNLGVLDFKDARYDDARRRLETALLLNPRNTRPHLYLGLIDRLEGDFASCLNHLKAAGADELAVRMEQVAGQSARERLADPGNSADTGPMRPIEASRVSVDGGIDLESALSAGSHGMPVASRGSEDSFTIRPAADRTATDTLEILFHRGIRFRTGTALSLHAVAGALEVSTPDPWGLIEITGSGRLELAPRTDQPGRIVLVKVFPGKSLRLAPGRLLAIEGRLSVRSDDGGSVTGEGIVALASARTTRAAKISCGELLLLQARDLICWSGDLSARPAGERRLDSILGARGQSDQAVTLEGAGQALFDAA